MLRHAFVLAALAALLFTFAGCGAPPHEAGSSEAPADNGLAQAPAAPPPPPPPALPPSGQTDSSPPAEPSTGSESPGPSDAPLPAPADRPDAGKPEGARTELAAQRDVDGLFVSADGTRLVTGHTTDEKPFKLWDLTTGEQLLSFGEPNRYAMAFSPHGKFLVLEHSGNQGRGKADGLCVMHIATGKQKLIPIEVTYMPNAYFSHDSRKVILPARLKGRRHALALFDVGTAKLTKKELLHAGFVLNAACSPVDATVAVSRVDIDMRTKKPKYLVELYDLQTLRLLKTLTPPASPGALAYSLDGGTLAVYTGAKAIMIWDTATWNTRATLTREETGAGFIGYQALAVSPDGTMVAAKPLYTGRPPVEVWDVRTGQMHEIGPWSRQMVFLPNSLLAVATAQAGVTFFDPRTGEERFPPVPKDE